MGTSTTQPKVTSPQEFIRAAQTHLGAGGDIEIRAGDAARTVGGEQANAVIALLSAIAAGRLIDLSPLPEQLTTGQAADVLGVSRPTVVALVDRGELAATRVGTHRRIETVQLLSFMQQRHNASSAAMDDLVRVSEELGLYDH